MDMLKKVKAWIDKYNLVPQKSIVLAACSGGPDSLALVHILNELSREYDFSLAVGHVDHMFRGEESREDARFVADFCRRLGLQCFMAALDVPRFIKESGLSAEEAARVMRYDYLRKCAKELGGALIATGHHRDDQAETVLMHLLRGSGSDGLGGMKGRNGDIIRPLLVLSRQEIEDYCAQMELKPRLDSTNLTAEYLRNNLRLNLLPLLRREYNQAITDALCRTADIVGAEHDLVRKMAEAAWSKAVNTKDSGRWFIEIKAVASLHVAVQRELFRRIIETRQGHLRGISFLHVEKLIELSMAAESGSILKLPGKCIFRREYGHVLVETEEEQAALKIGLPGIILTVPGVTFLPDGRFVEAKLYFERPTKKEGRTAVFDWRQLKKPLIVRSRLPGDRFQPLGMAGNKKVKDFFIDAKVPRKARDEALIFCDAEEILWVGGYRQAEYGKITDVTEEFLELSVVKG